MSGGVPGRIRRPPLIQAPTRRATSCPLLSTGLAMPRPGAAIPGGAQRRTRSRATPGNLSPNSSRAGHHVVMTRLSLNADRLLSADPVIRELARELYAAVRDLPIISPHGHVPAQWLADDVPFEDPTSLLITPDHYVTRLLARAGCAAVRPGRRTDGVHRRPVAQCVPDPVLALEGVPGHAGEVLARVRAGRHLRHRRRPLRADRRRDLRRDLPRSSPTPEFRPRALYESLRDRVPRHHRRPLRRPAPPHQARERPDVGGQGGSDLPPGQVPRARHPGLERPGRHARRGLGHRHRHATPAGSPRWRTGAPSSRPTAPSPPTTPTATPGSSRSATPRPSGSTPWPEQARSRAEEGNTLRRNFMFQQARMAADDGLVMTLHPAVYRNHHTPTFERYGADVGADIPMAVEFTNAVQPMLAAFGTAAELPGRASSPSTRRSTRASSRRWPASTPRSTSARRGGSSTPPRR